MKSENMTNSNAFLMQIERVNFSPKSKNFEKYNFFININIPNISTTKMANF